MHKFRVSEQSITHSMLCAVTISWHVIPPLAAAAPDDPLPRLPAAMVAWPRPGTSLPAESCSGRSARKSP